MQCDVHKDRETVGFCEACGRMVCRDCAVAIDGKLFCREDASKLNAPAEPTKAALSGSAADIVAEPARKPRVGEKVIDPVNSEHLISPVTVSTRREPLPDPADNNFARGGTPGEEHTLRVINSLLVFTRFIFLLFLSLMVLALSGLIYLLARAANASGDFSIVADIAIGSLVTTGILLAIVWKYPVKKTVRTAFHFIWKRWMNTLHVFLADDGIYFEAPNNIARRRYQLLPWSKIKIMAVNEEEKVIGLKSGMYELRLGGNVRFDELKSFVIGHAARGEPVWTVTEKVRLVSLPRLVAIVAGLVIIYLVVGAVFDGLPAINPPDDGLCDLDGQPAVYKLFHESVSTGVITYDWEYCPFHTFVYAVVHPDGILTADLSPGSDNGIVIVALVALACWLFLLAIGLYYSIPRWRRTRLYKMV